MKILHDEQAQQINYLDERFYTEDGVTYYPSVTTILEVYPKGYGYTAWLKNMGLNADQIAKDAAAQGSKIHDAIDHYLKGEELLWVASDGSQNFSFEEWMMILKFVEFENKYKPKTIAQEKSLVDADLEWGGTLDRVCIIENELWLVDYKAANYIHKIHELQLAAYRALWNKKNPENKIVRSGILHLKALTRGPDPKGVKIQGKGWKMEEFERPWQDALSLFRHSKSIWKEENPNYTPKNEQYPDRVQLLEVNKIK